MPLLHLRPELTRVGEFAFDDDGNFAHPETPKRTSQMMAINQPVAAIRPDDHGDPLLLRQRPQLLGTLVPQLLNLLFDL